MHANLPALEAVLDEAPRVQLLHAGDVVGYNPYPAEVIELMREKRILSVLGNHDYAVLTGDVSAFNPVAARAIAWTRSVLEREHLEYLSQLELELRMNSLCCVHGSPGDALWEYVHPGEGLELHLRNAGAEMLVLGHTHVPFYRKLGSGAVLNPGSVGQPRDGSPLASFAVLRGEEVEMLRVEYPVHRVAKEILRAGLPAVLAQRLYSGW